MKTTALYFAMACLVALNAGAADYRVDSQQAFDQLSRKAFEPGDSILFKRGVTFTGMFRPKGSGTEAKPIRLDVYGQGDRPVINAQAKHQAGLLLKNVSFWEVNGLEITNTDGTDADQGDLFGIHVLADDDEGVYKHIHINDCYIHDVNGKVGGKRRGGIHVHINRLKRSRFDDLRITHNRIEHVGGVGIGNSSSCGAVQFRGEGRYRARNLWTNVYVADNVVAHTGRNGIIARTSIYAVYERNTLAHNSRHSTGHSIFNFNTAGIKIQYNEAYGNVGPEGHDRGGFDADFNSVNTIIQYNYSHDNEWFCGIMKRPNHNVIIRHNISQNDRQGIYFYGFENEKNASNIQIYNNTHYIKKGLDVQVLAENRTPINSVFKRNIFYFEDKGRWGSRSEGRNTVFTDNVYYNLAPHPSDTKARTRDPKLVDAGQAGQDIDLHTMKSLEGYRLNKDSPYRGYGATLPGWGEGE